MKRVVLCSGKVYYDLLEQRRKNEQTDVAIVRIEQLYPFPEKDLRSALAGYPGVERVTWVQEEPANMGAWRNIRHHLEECLSQAVPLEYAGRPAAASPATGSHHVHVEEEAALVEAALGG